MSTPSYCLAQNVLLVGLVLCGLCCSWHWSIVIPEVQQVNHGHCSGLLLLLSASVHGVPLVDTGSSPTVTGLLLLLLLLLLMATGLMLRLLLCLHLCSSRANGLNLSMGHCSQGLWGLQLPMAIGFNCRSLWPHNEGQPWRRCLHSQWWPQHQWWQLLRLWWHCIGWRCSEVPGHGCIGLGPLWHGCYSAHLDPDAPANALMPLPLPTMDFGPAFAAIGGN